jgi:hypothetical protein
MLKEDKIINRANILPFRSLAINIRKPSFRDLEIN